MIRALFSDENMSEKIHNSSPELGAALLKDNTNHIILMHDHTETDDMVPEYYKKIIDYVIEQGVAFITPKFI
jgi:peptidoglycan/xylan/chitin deacetylase (PgdA/CDA1 family)